LIVDAPVRMAPSIHGGHGTIAVRVPANSVAVALADAFGGLLTATSANRTGEPPAVTASELDAWAADDRMLVLDGGQVPGGRPSTIVDARGDAPILIREGALDWDRVLESLHE
jgi:L-threonylcarbamoyladenylate synthase